LSSPGHQGFGGAEAESHAMLSVERGFDAPGGDREGKEGGIVTVLITG